MEAFGSLDESPLEFFAIDLAAKMKNINIFNQNFKLSVV